MSIDLICVPTTAEQVYDEALLADPSQARRAWGELNSQIAAREICFSKGRLPASIKPHFVMSTTHAAWVEATERFCHTLERFGRLVLSEKDLYVSLHLPPGARELIDLDPGYERFAVVCRPDLAWSGERLWMYEVNSDSPAMMTFTDHLQEIQRGLFPMARVAEHHKITYWNRTQALLETLVSTYHEWGGKEEAPTIAIVDWRDEKTAKEQSATAKRFTELGCAAFTCDPRELSIRDGKLIACNRAIDIVQRRVLFPDFLTRSESLATLIRAYRERLACVVNPLRSYLLGSKGLLALLQDPSVLSHLSPEDRTNISALVPRTIMITDQVLRDLSAERVNWVLKGAFSYGGHQVVIGRTIDQAKWESAIAMSTASLWIAQEYCQPPVYRVPRFTDSDAVSWDELYANWNPFLFGGRFAGAMTRVGGSLVVSITARGALLPCLAVSGSS